MEASLGLRILQELLSPEIVMVPEAAEAAV
jgi:hypothetical protein